MHTDRYQMFIDRIQEVGLPVGKMESSAIDSAPTERVAEILREMCAEQGVNVSITSRDGWVHYEFPLGMKDPA